MMTLYGISNYLPKVFLFLLFFFCMGVSYLTGTLSGCSDDLVIGIEHGDRKWVHFCYSAWHLGWKQVRQ